MKKNFQFKKILEVEYAPETLGHANILKFKKVLPPPFDKHNI